MHCPSCNGHEWPDTLRGLRTCPQCGASIKLTKRGAEQRTLRVFHTLAQREPMARRRLYAVVNPDDLHILCAACAQPTTLLSGTDGRITADPRKGVPNVRGVICAACVVKYGAQPVGRPAGRGRQWAGGPETVIGKDACPTWNSKAQREEAEYGLAVLGKLWREGRTVDYGAALQGANWAHVENSEWLSHTSVHGEYCQCVRCAVKRMATVRESLDLALRLGRLPLTPALEPTRRLAGGIASTAIAVAGTFARGHVPRKRRPVYIDSRGRVCLRLVTERATDPYTWVNLGPRYAPFNAARVRV